MTINIKRIHGMNITTAPKMEMTRDWANFYSDVPVTIKRSRTTIGVLLSAQLARLNAARIVRERAEYRAAIAAANR